MKSYSINELHDLTKLDRRTLRKRLADVTPTRTHGKARYFTLEQVEAAFRNDAALLGDRLPPAHLRALLVDQINKLCRMLDSYNQAGESIRTTAVLIEAKLTADRLGEFEIPAPRTFKHLFAAWREFFKLSKAMSGITEKLYRFDLEWQLTDRTKGPINDPEPEVAEPVEAVG